MKNIKIILMPGMSVAGTGKPFAGTNMPAGKSTEAIKNTIKDVVKIFKASINTIEPEKKIKKS